MRHQAVLLAAFGLALALPVSAAINLNARTTITAPAVTAPTTVRVAPVVVAPVSITAAPVALPASVTAEAGILPTSPLSFIDQALNSLSIALTFTPAARTDAALQVAQENAAEAAVMSAQGDVALTTTSVARVDTALDTAIAAAIQVTEPTAAAGVQQQLQASTTAAETTLNLGVQAAPVDTRAQIQAIMNPAIGRLSTAPSTVADSNASATANGCVPAAFSSCVTSNGCTLNTSQNCFLACPPISVPCQRTSTGKTCSMPDTACVNTCLQKIASCTELCLSQSNCRKDEVSTSTLQIIAPEEIQRAFQLQLQAGAAGAAR